MRIILAIALVILIAGCSNNIPPEISGGQVMQECSSDSDCQRGGCSGTICESKLKEPVVTTCEFKPEYECYRDIECRCMDNRCSWERTEEFENCLFEKSQIT